MTAQDVETAIVKYAELKQEARRILLVIAAVLGPKGFRDFASPTFGFSGEHNIVVRWKENFRGELYAAPEVEFPLRFFDWSSDELRQALYHDQAQFVTIKEGR